MTTQKTTIVPSQLQNWCQLVRGNVTPLAADIRLKRKSAAVEHLSEMTAALKELGKLVDAL